MLSEAEASPRQVLALLDGTALQGAVPNLLQRSFGSLRMIIRIRNEDACLAAGISIEGRDE